MVEVCHLYHVILQIIRKVEKQSVVLDADENISQLHKVSSTICVCEETVV